MRDLFHPWAWLLWAVAALAPALMTRNPLYQSIILGATLINLWAVSRAGRSTYGWNVIVRLAAWLAVLSVGANVLMVHHGEYVWARLPDSWPIVGGPLTVEAALFGLASGLALLSLLLIFATLNAGMSADRWLRLVPGFLYQAGVVTSIGVTFVPVIARTARDVYDAQRLRGHRFRRLTDYAPLFTPVLVDSLERSIQLAASMAARGFGASARPLSAPARVLVQLVLWLGLMMVLAGMFVRAYWQQHTLTGNLILAIGVLTVVGTFWMQGRRVRRTAYRRWYWRARDTLLALGSLVLLAVTVAVRVSSPAIWLYYPYPPYDLWPTFRLVPGALLLLVALPAVVMPVRAETDGPVGRKGRGRSAYEQHGRHDVSQSRA